MKKLRVHFIGIKGVGMCALALYLKEKGFLLTGSDVKEEFVTDKILKHFKIPVKSGFDPDKKRQKPDLVVVTGAHGGKTNPEAVYYMLEGVEVLTHGQALGKFMEGKFGISVAGVGGKTTTSAMIATILCQKPLDASYVIGVGGISPLGQPGHYGKSKFFIAEADEYASCPITDRIPRFYYQHPKIIVITNIEYDHPDLYSSLAETKKVFRQFVNSLPTDGLLIINGDNTNNQEIARSASRKVITYGFSKENDYQIEKVQFAEGVTRFVLRGKNISLGEFVLNVPGKFNILNATASIVTALSVGLPILQIQKGLAAFLGTKRRFELIKSQNGNKLFDDYAHHPSEIQMTLLAAHEWYPKHQIICVFQPHTFSRTKALLAEFSKCFGLSDEVYILPIFPSAREKEDKSINSLLLVNEIARYHHNVFYVKDLYNLIIMIKKRIRAKKMIIITMGAGDIYKFTDNLKKIL